MKRLYFEGAGWFGADSSKASDLLNCRIRTAFHDDAGLLVYLEICDGMIWSCHYISTEKDHSTADDENKSKVCDKNGVPVERGRVKIEHTKAGVLKFLKEIGATFDEVDTAPELSNYHVFKDGVAPDCPACDNYNYGDKYSFDPAIIERAERLKKSIHDTEQAEGKKYPNFSLWADCDDQAVYHILRHFNGYNKQWRVNIANDGFLDVQTWTEEKQTI